MKKILFVATVSQHFYYFHLPCFKMFKELGWQVDVACSGDIKLDFCDNQYTLPIKRSPANKDNIKAYKELKKIIKNNNYDIIHCHTPMGGMLTRVAARKERKNGTKVLYTAHGFHFYKGAPKLNWLVYFPIEFVLSYITDGLLTINDEDYSTAIKKLKAKETFKVDGVGYNSDLYFPISESEKQILKKEKGYAAGEKILIYVAEMNKNKNQAMLIRAIDKLKKDGEKVRLLIAGEDNYNGNYKALAIELGVDDIVDFLGHRQDVHDLLCISDIAVGSSLREGLPVNVMEAMACGLPVVLSDNRGHRALCKDGENGFLVGLNDYQSMAEKIKILIHDDDLYRKFSAKATENVKSFSKESVVVELEKIYSHFI